MAYQLVKTLLLYIVAKKDGLNIRPDKYFNCFCDSVFNHFFENFNYKKVRLKQVW